MRFYILVTLALMLMVRPVAAQLLDFDFSITADDGKVVTGKISGLASSGISTPTEITIFSQPVGYTYPAESLLANGYLFLPGANTFTVTAGVITGANIGIYKNIGTGGDLQGYGFNVTVGTTTNANGIYQAIGTTVTSDYNTGGLGGVTYTPVPEPRETAVLLLLAGIGLLIARKLRTRILTT